MNTHKSHAALRALLFVFLAAAAILLRPRIARAAEGDPVVVDNGIPVVYLNIDESQGTIEQMIDSPNHSVYCYGTVTITVPEGFHYTDFPDLACEGVQDLAMSIRGRGNSTWQQSPKKPFKIKLDKKTDIFGLGKNKHWVLIANWFDATLLRDRITGWIGDKLDFGFTPRGVPVDLVMTGSEYGSHYLGSYYLSENVRVDDNRLEIAELGADDTDPAVITGGYLLQNGSQVGTASPDQFYTSRHANWATHTPSFDPEDTAALGAGEGSGEGEEAFAGAELGDGYVNPTQQQYIQDYVQHFEDVLFDEGTAYRDLMDVTSAAKYWLLNAATVNGDAFATGSTYLYKDRDPEGGVAKFFWGPLWDFDFAWGHRLVYTGFEYGHLWSKPMLYDSGEGGFLREVHKQWPAMKAAMEELIAEGGIIDRYAAETEKSACANHETLHPGTDFDYLKEVETLKAWIRKRIDWMDESFDQIDTLVHRVRYYVDGEIFKTDFMSADEPFLEVEIAPEKEGYIFLGWTDQDGDPIDNAMKITRDIDAAAQYLPEDEAILAEDIVLSKYEDILTYSYYLRGYQIRYEVIPTSAQDKRVTWTSDSEDFATVDPDGMIHFEGEGTVTVTGTLKSGKSRTFTLTVTRDPYEAARSIAPVEKVIYLTVGQQSGCPVTSDPVTASGAFFRYESADEGVVTVSENGVLTAVGPGQTTVHITMDSHGTPEDTVCQTDVTVIVTEKESVTYTVTEDSVLTWTRGSSALPVIRVKRSEADDTCLDHFTGVTLDGTALTAGTDFDAARGSTVVTMPAAAMEALSDGTHEIEVLFDDGSVKARITVRPEESSEESSGSDEGDRSEAPDTGERTGPAGWILLAAAALAAVLSLRRKDA